MCKKLGFVHYTERLYLMRIFFIEFVTYASNEKHFKIKNIVGLG